MAQSLNESRTEKTKRLKTIPRSRLEEVLRQTLSEVKDRRRELPLEFNLQCLPLSTNMMSGRSKTYETKEFLEYRNLVAHVAGGTYGITKDMQFRADVVVGYSNKRADADNCLKPLFDAITACVDSEFDDSQIYRIDVTKKVVGKGHEFISLCLDLYDERWVTIKDYPRYEVSNLGQVRNLHTGRILKGQYNDEGYERVLLYTDIGSRKESVHRLVANAFISNPKEKPSVNHKDEIKRNNNRGNLEWTDHKKNYTYSSKIVYHFLNPEGVPVTTMNLTAFAKELGVSYGRLAYLFKQPKASLNGWRGVKREYLE